jgi:phosphohistidine phosphatase
MAKTLLILRHGKAESAERVDKTDFERTLTARGESNSRAIGIYVAEKGLTPDLIVTSMAARALATARNIAAQCGDVALEENDTVYGAYSNDLLSIILELDESLSTVMIVGHNPTLENIVDELTDSYDTVMKTCSLAILKTTKKSWSEIQIGDFKLIALQNPRDLDTTL